MKEILNTNWGFMRVLRFVLGVAFLFSAYKQLEWIPAIIGGLFMYQSIFNVGCIGGACYAPPTKQSTKIDDVEYEEIK
jgi:hypothetical protein